MRKTTYLNFLIILIALISIFISGCTKDNDNEKTTTPAATTTPTETTAPTEPQFDIDAYKKLVSDCVDELSNGSIVLLNVVKYEYTYWNSINKLSGTFKPDKVVSAAMNWLEENSNYTEAGIHSQYEDIALMYKEIIAISTDGNEAQNIFESFDELYDAYIGLYNMGTSPSGTIDTFASNYDNYYEIVEACTAKLETLLS